MRTTLKAAAAAGTVATMVLGGAVLSGTTAAQAGGGRQLAGTWAVTVDPDGEAPSFTSTLVYTATGSVVETTSGRPPSAVSTGLGTWERLGDGQFATTHTKHRWNGPTYLGTVVVHEVSEVASDGESYTARATARFLDRDGREVQPALSSSVTAARL